MSLRHVLLALLSKQPNTGYGLGRLLRGRLSHLWNARLQQIYSELSRLEMEGLVRAECAPLLNRPAKKTYALTPAGDEALDRWLARSCVPAPPKDELLVKLFCLERLPLDTLLRRLEEERHRCEQTASDLRRQHAETQHADGGEPGLALTIDAALALAEARAAWCERAACALQEANAAASSLRVPHLRVAEARAAYRSRGRA